MRITKLATTLAITAATLAFTASAANAAPVFSPVSGYATLSGTLTLTAPPLSPKICTVSYTLSYYNTVSGGRWPVGQQYPPCADGSLPFRADVTSTSGSVGAYTVSTMGSHLTYAASPWGTGGSGYKAGPWTAAFTNGAGATPSTVTFNNTQIGTLFNNAYPVRVTGTLQFKQFPSGGLITLN